MIASRNRFAMLTLVALLATPLGGCLQTATGRRVGMIVKVARVGLFCPTWEAEIVRGGFAGGSGVNGKSFDFTIENDADADALTKAMDDQKEVEISYRKEAFTFCRSDSGGHFLAGFKVK